MTSNSQIPNKVPVFCRGCLVSTGKRRLMLRIGDDGWLRKNPSKDINGKDKNNVIAANFGDEVVALAA